MIVFGDPQRWIAATHFSQTIQAFLGQIDPASLNQLRTLLIQVGQLEQGLADSEIGSTFLSANLLRQSCEITDLAASAFCSAWIKSSRSLAESIDINHVLAQLSERFHRFELPGNLSLKIKTPEGFEFYALYPEQYCASTLEWTTTHSAAPNRKALVVGLRSIGTTLSAIVCAVLNTQGWQNRRITVRPHGPPFQRQIDLPHVNAAEFSNALIVDEGPGISGSSMAATAQALQAKGLRDIFLLPGHDGQPGSAASPQILKCWNETPRLFTPFEQLKWNGMSLRESLAAKATEFSKASERFDRVEDLSAGEWRKFTFASQAEWPAVAAQFERMKFRCANRTGKAVLWKFVGLGSSDGIRPLGDSAFEQTSGLAEKGFTARPLGIHLGFIATPWIEGIRLSRADANPAVLARIGEYLAASAQPPLSNLESEAAIERLAEMLYWNTREALNQSSAERTRDWSAVAKNTQCPFSYGDGHMAAHEWIRTNDSILKVDCEGHDSDHTIVGRQSLLWDIAGAITEWDLGLDSATPLLAPLKKIGVHVESGALEFYLLAYSAFRLGLMSLSCSQTSDPFECARIENAILFYKRRLIQQLQIRNSNISPLRPNHQSAAH